MEQTSLFEKGQSAPLASRMRPRNLKEFVELLDSGFYKPLPLKDFNGRNLVYLDSVAQV